MLKPDLYVKTVDSLLLAYEQGELRHGDCVACAVGNLCGGWGEWISMFATSNNENVFTMTQQVFKPLDAPYIRKKLKELTGYNVRELMKIEFAFESASGWEDFLEFSSPVEEGDACWSMGKAYKTDPTYMYNGLKAVLEVLADIHKLPSSEVSQQKLTNIHLKLEPTL